MSLRNVATIWSIEWNGFYLLKSNTEIVHFKGKTRFHCACFKCCFLFYSDLCIFLVSCLSSGTTQLVIVLHKSAFITFKDVLTYETIRIPGYPGMLHLNAAHTVTVSTVQISCCTKYHKPQYICGLQIPAETLRHVKTWLLFVCLQ